MYWEKYKLDYDHQKLSDELDNLFPRDIYNYHDEHPVPEGTYYYNVKGTMPNHIVEAIERSIGYKVKDYFFLWDWRNQCTTLLKHKDRRNNQFGEVPSMVAIVSLEGTFRLDVWTEENGEIFDSMVYNPGDVIVLNNTEWYHSGELLDKTQRKRSLNCYIEIDYD